jgi:CDP-glucose 4,6-dehydratase
MILFSDAYRDRSVFITGVTGFKGSWMALWLSMMGAKVTGYALRPHPPSHFDFLNLGMDMHYEDIRDGQKLEKLLRASKPDIVFHLAAQSLVRYSYANPKETFETNVIGTLNLFEACRNCDSIKAVINVTSDKCYENKEWIWPYRENEPMGGFDPYSASKGCSELLTASYRNSFFNPDRYGRDHHILIASCRAGNVIGGGDWAEDRLVPDIVKAASQGKPVDIRNPHAVRPWQHVLEPLSGYLMLGEKLLNHASDYAEAWNFGPDETDNQDVMHVLNLMQKNWDQVRYQLPADKAKLHEATLLRLDSTKARVKLGWKSIWHTDTAVKMTADWYRAYYESNRLLTRKQLDSYIADAFKAGSAWIHS